MRDRHLAFLDMLTDQQPGIAKPAFGVGWDICFGDAYIVDEGAVSGVQITQHQSVWGHANFGMSARDRTIAQHDIVVQCRADAHRRQAETSF